MVLILNPSYTGDQGSRVTSLALEPLFPYNSKQLEQICMVDSCLSFELLECNAMLKTSRTVTKHSNRDCLDLLESEQVL